jgi:hypothetical protein
MVVGHWKSLGYVIILQEVDGESGTHFMFAVRDLELGRWGSPALTCACACWGASCTSPTHTNQ